MQILLPHNIFTYLFTQSLPIEMKKLVKYYPASILTSSLSEGKGHIALIPTLDLLKHNDLYISSKLGISFEGSLSNSYVYFTPYKQGLSNVALAGDISTVETILLKIWVREMYDSEVQIRLAENAYESTESRMITGDKNFSDANYLKGLSFSEEIVELISYPFVNYVFASKNKEVLEEFHKQVEVIEQKIYDSVDSPEWDVNFNEETKEYFRENMSHVIYEFDEQDREGINELIKLPYYHGMVEDIKELKFI